MPKRRIIHILLLPILAPILLAGCILSFISEPKARKTKRVTASALKTQGSKKENFEVGLIEEITEEPITNA